MLMVSYDCLFMSFSPRHILWPSNVSLQIGNLNTWSKIHFKEWIIIFWKYSWTHFASFYLFQCNREYTTFLVIFLSNYKYLQEELLYLGRWLPQNQSIRTGQILFKIKMFNTCFNSSIIAARFICYSRSFQSITKQLFIYLRRRILLLWDNEKFEIWPLHILQQLFQWCKAKDQKNSVVPISRDDKKRCYISQL